MIALPHKPMIMMEAPSLVNLPNPSKASGHMPAHTSEFARPNKTTNQIEISVVCPKKLTEPLVKIISNVNITPNTVHILNIFTWLMNLGISEIPMI